MYAIWKYDSFPYILTGKVIGEIDDDGYVEVKGYGGMRFKPIKLISEKNGKKVQELITNLRHEKREQDKKLNEKAKKEIDKFIS